MFICDDCGAIFEDCKIIKDPRPYGIGECYEEFALCPECESSEFSEAVKCSRCDEIIAKEDCEYSENLEYLCEKCYEELYGE